MQVLFVKILKWFFNAMCFYTVCYLIRFVIFYFAYDIKSTQREVFPEESQSNFSKVQNFFILPELSTVKESNLFWSLDISLMIHSLLLVSSFLVIVFKTEWQYI